MATNERLDGDEGFAKFEEFLGEWSRRDFIKRMGAGVAFTAFMAGGLEFLEACANAGQSPSTQPSVNAVKGGHLVEGSISDIKNLNPVLESDTASNIISGMLYDGLLGSKANGDLYPQLAKDMPKSSSDGLTYTFTLRDDIKFSDGSPITSADVKFTYDLMFDPKNKDVNSPRRGDLETYLESVTAPDPKTVVFKTKKVYAPFLVSHGGYGIMPQKVWGSLSPKEINTSDMNNNPTVTSGMFLFGKWEKGQQVVLNKNPKYYLGSPNIDQYIYKVVADSVALANQLKTGELDFGQIDPSQLSNVQANPDVQVTTFPVAIFTFYAYNQNPGTLGARLFQQKEVRQALLYGLNREQFVSAIYFNQAVVAKTSMPPVSFAYNDNPKVQYSYDKAKAQTLLDSAGWKVGPDGIRSNGTDKLQFTMITNAGNKVRENLLSAMQQQWKDIGVSATPKTIQFPDLVNQIQNARSYDIFLVGFSWGQDPDQSQLWGSASAQPGGFNGFNYKNSTMDKILDDAVSTLDRNKRKQLYAQMQDQLNDDLPAPILVFNKGIWGAQKRMQNFGGDLGLGTYTQFGSRPWMRTVFVADGK